MYYLPPDRTPPYSGHILGAQGCPVVQPLNSVACMHDVMLYVAQPDNAEL